MKPLYKLATIISFLVGFWVYLSIGNPQFKLSPWIGFVAWATFFAAGGTINAAKSSGIVGVTSILLTAATLYAIGLAGGTLSSMLILVPILSFILVAMSQYASLSYTPAAFLGAACYFGAASNFDISIIHIVLSWIAGIALGFISVSLDKIAATKA